MSEGRDTSIRDGLNAQEGGGQDAVAQQMMWYFNSPQEGASAPQATRARPSDKLAPCGALYGVVVQYCCTVTQFPSRVLFATSSLTERHETKHRPASQLYSVVEERKKNFQHNFESFLVFISFDLLIAFQNNRSTLFTFCEIKNLNYVLFALQSV